MPFFGVFTRILNTLFFCLVPNLYVKKTKKYLHIFPNINTTLDGDADVGEEVGCVELRDTVENYGFEFRDPFGGEVRHLSSDIFCKCCAEEGFIAVVEGENCPVKSVGDGLTLCDGARKLGGEQEGHGDDPMI